MDTYIASIRTAFSMFPLVAIALTIPYILHSYRKYGAVSRLRTVIVFSFIFYMLCAYCLVVFPLPDREVVASMTTPATQLLPLQFVRDFVAKTTFRLTDVSTYIPALTNGLFLQPLFNLFLTVPFGIYLAYYFKLDKRTIVIMSFGLSLFFELTQLTGLYGVYPRPYRLFDVDDLLLNTLGGYVGYFIGCRVNVILPSRQAIDAENRRQAAQVTYLRRVTAVGIDMAVVSVATAISAFLLPVRISFCFVGVYFLYFVGLQSMLGGQTVGKVFVRIRTADGTDEAFPLLRQLLIKYALLLFFWILLPFIFLPVMALDALRSRAMRRPLLHERISGTRTCNSIPAMLPEIAA